jgi:hypothetical protein
MTGFPEHDGGEDTNYFFVVGDKNHRHVFTFFDVDRRMPIRASDPAGGNSCMAINTSPSVTRRGRKVGSS